MFLHYVVTVVLAVINNKVSARGLIGGAVFELEE